ncbi:MAG: helix-turn-helix domain-containing protein [Pseudonocardiaceae bacterium]
MPSPAPLTLRDGDHGPLEALARSTSARPSLAQRARIVLMSAEGLTNAEIARRTGATRPTVINWRKRYAAGGINALGDQPRPGRPAVVDELEVVATTLANGGHPPAHLGADHWSSRLLGQHLGISFTTVARIWRKWGIQPDHVEIFTLATDLKQQVQLRDISGLYLNLSQRAAALHRSVSDHSEEEQSPAQPDPWLKLVEVSLGIITQQAIRRGTFASVRNLIDSLGALTGGRESRHGLPHSGAVPEGDSGSTKDSRDTVVTQDNRQITSDTDDEQVNGSSRSGEKKALPGPAPLSRRAGDSKSMRAEFHGARGRRSGPRGRAGG